MTPPDSTVTTLATAPATPDAPGWVSPLPVELAAESARTWDAATQVPAVPDELRPPESGSVGERVNALRRRHLLRERRAQEFVADTMNARTGLPIADNHRVVRFIGSLLSQERGLVVVVVLANALAATAGLLVPRLLGELVDSTVADVESGHVDAALAGANTAALVVAGLVVVQSAFTLAAKTSSTVLGQSVLASAREFIVRAILRLPLSRVESASSGDLVTRVTRDVGTMSESVRWALPESIVASITVLLTLVAMMSNSTLLSLPSIVLMSLALIQVRRYLGRAEGLPHRGRHLLPHQHDPHRDRRGGAHRRGARPDAVTGCSAATRTSRSPRRPSATR